LYELNTGHQPLAAEIGTTLAVAFSCVCVLLIIA
jgi:hypothetical protein